MNAALKSEQFLTDAAGNPIAVVVDLESYKQLREAEEELADMAAYDDAKAKVYDEVKAGDYVTLEQLVAESKRGKK